ncbi:hypothetical protein D3H35_27535 [Cohnella faecalis]|uniref:Uncharacterized protein n=1 Tax=Cohnella faecalis TaxID=2315694 RepID=A0A398CDV4_9BACL|nr:hypothetical protein D3H35_27535 [Cohnella faecalis]
MNFPWERYSHVEVRTQYEDPEHRISQADSFVLSKETVTEASWKMFVMDSGKTRFRYKIIYRAVDFRDVELPWMETDEERLTIRDPFPTKRTLEIVPLFDWTKVDGLSWTSRTRTRIMACSKSSLSNSTISLSRPGALSLHSRTQTGGRSDSKRRLFAKTERCPRFRSRIPSRDVLP